MSESDNSSEANEAPPEGSREINESPSVSPDARHRGERFRHTRISAAWVSTVIGVIFGVALIDFIAQNTRDVKIEFFTANGRIPVAIALLAAAVLGAIVVLAIGIGRVAQLRLSMRRQRRQHRHEMDASSKRERDAALHEGHSNDT